MLGACTSLLIALTVAGTVPVSHRIPSYGTSRRATYHHLSDGKDKTIFLIFPSRFFFLVVWATLNRKNAILFKGKCVTSHTKQSEEDETDTSK